MSHRTVLPDHYAEGTTPVVTFQIVSELEVGFQPSTLTLTLFNYKDNEIINGWDAQDALNANGVTVDVDGNVSWQLTANDTIIVNPQPDLMQESRSPLPTPALLAKGLEAHIARFEWTWNSGARSGKYEIEIRIQTLVHP